MSDYDKHTHSGSCSTVRLKWTAGSFLSLQSSAALVVSGPPSRSHRVFLLVT